MNVLKPHVSLNVSNIEASVAFYEAAFRVTNMDGTTETFPNLGFIEVFVTEDVPSLSG